MIIVDVFRTLDAASRTLGAASCEVFAARVTADGDGLRVEGPEPGLVGGDQQVDDVEVARTTVRPSLINPEPLDDAALAGLASRV